MDLTILLAQSGQWEKYADVCQKAAIRFGDNPGPCVKARVAMCCALSDLNVVGTNVIGRWVDEAYGEVGPNAKTNLEIGLAKAVVDLRRGDLESAIKILEAATKPVRKAHLNSRFLRLLLEIIS